MRKLFFLILLISMGQYASQAQTTTRTTTVINKKVVTHKPHRKVTRKRTVHHTVTTSSKHGIKVVQDDAHNPYEGKPSRQNDGVKKNEARNINYQTGQPLPPSNGSNMK